MIFHILSDVFCLPCPPSSLLQRMGQALWRDLGIMPRGVIRAGRVAAYPIPFIHTRLLQTDKLVSTLVCFYYAVVNNTPHASLPPLGWNAAYREGFFISGAAISVLMYGFVTQASVDTSSTNRSGRTLPKVVGVEQAS